MKILIISVFPPAEVPDADHAYRISAHLADRGLDVHVLTQRGAQVLAHPNLHLYSVMDDWSWAEMRRVAGAVRRCSPDVVLLVYVGHMYHSHPMITYAAKVAKLVRPKTRFVTQIEHPSGAMVGRTWSRPARISAKAVRLIAGKQADRQFGTLLRDSDAVIVLSGAHMPVLQQAFPDVEAKSTLIPPPILMRMASDDDATRREEREALGVKPGEILLAYLGYIYHGKGVDTLLAAFEQICRRRSDVRLIIIGGTLQAASDPRPEYVQEVYAMAARPGIKDRVSFTGGFGVESENPSRLLHAADVVVLPLDPGIQLNNSSFGSVTAHGLPVVTTRGAHLEEPFVQGENVFLCPPRNPDAMAEAIEKVIDDPELRRRLEVGSRRIAEEWFSWNSAIDRMLTVFQQVTGRTETPPLAMRPQAEHAN